MTTESSATPAKQPKISVERHSLIAQHAEAPVGEAAATDAHEVHDAVAGGAQFGAHDLAEDRHVVAVEKSPAEAEENEEHESPSRRVPALPTPNSAGRNKVMPMALTKMRPRGVRRIHRSASAPPTSAPTRDAICT